MDIGKMKDIMIFRNMSDSEILSALKDLDASEKNYKKGSAILHAGSVTEWMGLVLKGSVTIENNDVWGNKTILSHVEEKQSFAETYGLLADEPMLVDVIANEDCHILFLRIGTLRRGISAREIWAFNLINNLLTISAYKNLALSGRSFHTAPKTIRGRVSSYLNSISIRKGQMEFDIPFDRQQMADYLNLERTALSKELRKMKDDGLIDFRKNHFLLKKPQAL